MKKQLSLFFLFLMAATLTSRADNENPIEIRADRTVIHVSKLELNGEETLLDVLEMFPDLMMTGFDEYLSGPNSGGMAASATFDTWALRLDNVNINGDVRLLLTQIKASLVNRIQICDNSGVGKGRTGDGRVIDVNLKRLEEGAHGFASIQGGTDNMFTPSGNVRLGSEKTDIWSSFTYKNNDLFKGTTGSEEKVHLQMTNRFSDKDKLLSYLKQSSETSKAVGGNRKDNVDARFRYFHNFNDKGTELLLLGGWGYTSAPADALKTNSLIWVAELNTPLAKGLSMMIGYEGDADLIRWTNNNSYYIMNNDAYLSFNYIVGPVRLTIGDRLMCYKYKWYDFKDATIEDASKTDVRNNIQGSAVFTLGNNQIQLGYFRKFRNPSHGVKLYSQIGAGKTYTTEDALFDQIDQELIIDQYRLQYGFGKTNFTAKVGGSFYNAKTDGVDDSDHKYLTVDGALYYKNSFLGLTAGFNVYSLLDAPTGVDKKTFADVRLSPTFYLPGDFQIGIKAIFFSKDAPRAKYKYNGEDKDSPIYGTLQLNKQFGEEKNWDLSVQWHDMFTKWYDSDKLAAGSIKRGGVLIGVAYRF